MDTALRPATRSPIRTALAFLGVFVVLYTCIAGIAELRVARQGTDTAFQKLFAFRGGSVNWIVLGASHALPLEYGEVPERLFADTGRSMLVLGEVGAGPLYNRFVFDQALHDLEIRRLLYVVDSFAFAAPLWNEERIAERKLLRQTPLRLSTSRILSGLVLEEDVDPQALLDYLTAFSKLNPPNRFPEGGWRGAADFDRSFRPSRHAVAARLSYLYPEGAPGDAALARYLDDLMALFDRAASEGIIVTVIKPPVPPAFGAALPGEARFDEALAERLASRGLDYRDLSGTIPDPALYFDTDHLNRRGVDTLYRKHLLDLLADG